IAQETAPLAGGWEYGAYPYCDAAGYPYCGAAGYPYCGAAGYPYCGAAGEPYCGAAGEPGSGFTRGPDWQVAGSAGAPAPSAEPLPGGVSGPDPWYGFD